MAGKKERWSSDNPFKHIRQKSDEDWILYWICEDPYFIKLKSEYLDICNNLGKENDDAKNIREKIIDTFGLTDFEWGVIQTGFHSQGSFDFPFEIVSELNDEKLTISMSYSIKRKEYINAWDELKEYLDRDNVVYADGEPVYKKTKQKRNRAADDTQLIYAIYMARRGSFTFREIFEKYQKGTLPKYFDKPRNQFASEDSLERYYNRHKPDR